MTLTKQATSTLKRSLFDLLYIEVTTVHNPESLIKYLLSIFILNTMLGVAETATFGTKFLSQEMINLVEVTLHIFKKLQSNLICNLCTRKNR